MHANLADAAHAVLDGGVALRGRLEAGEVVDSDLECGNLKALLADFAMDAGEVLNEFDFVFSEHANVEERRRLTQSTIRLSLSCWLDECLSVYPSVTMHRFGAADGAVRFWEEARYAETRGDMETLEVMYLCVMLGLRGAWSEKPGQVEAWAARVRSRLSQTAPVWTMPASLDHVRATAPFDDLPTLRVGFSLLLAVSLLMPVVAILFWRMV